MEDCIEKRMGVRIAALRQYRKVTPEQLGSAIGVTKNRVTRIEKGVSEITVGQAAALAGILGVRVSVLIGEDAFLSSSDGGGV